MSVRKNYAALCIAAGVVLALTGCNGNLKTSKTYGTGSDTGQGTEAPSAQSGTQPAVSNGTGADSSGSTSAAVSTGSHAEPGAAAVAEDVVTSETIAFDTTWKYAENSKIHTDPAVLYHAKPSIAKGKVICINAGHGTKGGTEVKTLCHPDGTPKVTGGTTESGATEAVAVSTGTEFLDGTPEAEITLKLALVVKEKLLDAGYDVLMIREDDDVQLDNVARTVMANEYADCHIALHYDSTDFDKGVFFMSVPSDESYRSMEPVASHWKEHNALGEAVVHGIEAEGFKLFEGGALEMDLTQTSYSTIPSIDLEVGDQASDYSDKVLQKLAEGILAGLDAYKW